MKTIALIPALLFGLILPVQAGDDLRPAIEADYAYLEDLYIHLHQNPELSYHEDDTAARLAAELSGLGYDVTQNVGGHGLVAVLENGEGPTLMLRADMDALPVAEQTGLPYASTVTTTDEGGANVPVMHACGHDVHMTVFVGTARRLAALRDQWSGTLVLIGQPAEERGAGAEAMLEDGLYERFPLPDYVVALHTAAHLPAGTVGLVDGWALANVDSVDITVHGVGGHGSMPHTTRDPILIGAQIVNNLQTIVSRNISPQSPAVITVGSFHGGTKHNIISDRVDMQLTVRSYADDVRAQLLNGIRRVTENTARALGISEDNLPDVRIREEEYTPSTYNDPELGARIARVLDDNENIRIIEDKPTMAGEDFSRYGRTDHDIPAYMLWLGSVAPERYREAQAGGSDLPSLHSPFFAPLPEPTIKTGVAAMTDIALDILAEE